MLSSACNRTPAQRRSGAPARNVNFGGFVHCVRPQICTSLSTHQLSTPIRQALPSRAQAVHPVNSATTSSIESASTAPMTSLKKITGKTVVVTGGSQGVGREVALSMARKGYNVVVVARQPDRLQEVATLCGDLAKRPEAGMAYPADVSDDSSMRQLADMLLQRYESIDILINNAGICMTGAAEDTSIPELTRIMGVNFLGPASLTTYLLPYLKKKAQEAKAQGKPGPSVVMVNSFVARLPAKYMTAYTASKYALAGWTDALRAEVGSLGLHVGQVQPGVIKSDFLERAVWLGEAGQAAKKSMEDMFEGRSPLPLQTPSEVAAAVVDNIEQRQNETIVGPFFSAAINTYRLTGTNILDVRP